MNAGTLEISLLANMSRLADDMKKAQSTVQGAMKGIEESAESAKKALELLGVGLSFEVLRRQIEGVISSMTKLQDASEKTGASVENLSKLQFFADVSGSSIDAVTSALAKLSKGMASAGNDWAPASQALKYLGLSAKDAAGNLKDPSALMTEISKKLIDFQDGAGKAAIAQALFGKAGAEMLPTLKKMAELGEVQATTTTEQAHAAEEFEVAQARLHQQSTILWNNLVGAILPSLQTFVEVMIEASKETGSLGAVVKGLAADGSLERWADAAVMGVARVIDVLKILPKLISAIASSFEVVWADVKLAVAALSLNPLTMASKLAMGQNPLEAFTKTLNERNDVLAAANKKYDDLWNAEGDATSKRMAAAIAARKAAAAEGGDFEAEDFMGDGKKKLNFSLGDAAKAAAEQKLYENALQSLENKLGKVNEQTNEQRILYELVYGSLQKLSTATNAEGESHAGNVLALAKELDKKEQLIAVAKDGLAQALAYTEATEKQDAVLAKANEQHSIQIQNIEFETQMIAAQAPLVASSLLTKQDELTLTSQVNLQRDVANGLRQIELQLNKDILALGPETNAGYAQAAKTLRDLAAAQKEALPDALAAKASAQLVNDLNRNSISQFQTFWGSVDSAGKASFEYLLGQGTNTFKSIGQTLKTAVVDVLYSIIAKPWIIQIGASLAGTLGIGSATTVAGAASGLGSGLSLASGLNTVSGWLGLPSIGPGSLSSILGIGGTAATSLGSGVFAGTAGATTLGTGVTAGSVMGTGALGGGLSIGGGATGAIGGEALGSGLVIGEAATAGAAAGASTGIMAALAAVPGWGWAAAAALALFSMSGGGGPKASDASLRDRGGGVFGVEMNNVAGGDPDMAQVNAFNALINDRTKFDPGVLASLANTQVSTGSPADTATLIGALAAKLAPAADAAAAAQQKLAADTQSLADATVAATAAMADMTKVVSSAVDDQISALNTALGNTRTIADAFRKLASTIADTIISLKGGALSTLAPVDKLSLSRTTLNAVFSAALGGDQDALTKLPQVATDFLTASRDYNASSTAYAADFQAVMEMLAQAEQVSSTVADVQDEILAIQTDQLSLLNQIKAALENPAVNPVLIASLNAQLQNDQVNAAGLQSTLDVQLSAVRANFDASLAINTAALGAGSAATIAALNTSGAAVAYTVATTNAAIAQTIAATGVAAGAGDASVVASLSAGFANLGSLLQQLVALSSISSATTNYATLKATSDSLRDAQLAYVQAHGGGFYSAEDIASGKPQYVSYQVGDQTAISMGTAYGNAFQAAVAAYQAIPKHATGLDYVPHDDYVARLHEGERVQNRSEATAWRASRSGNGNAELKAEIAQLRRDVAMMSLNMQQSGRDQVTALTGVGDKISDELSKTNSHLRRVTPP